MYQFSRAIYLELAPRISRREGDDEAYAVARNDLLRACEATIERMASDHRYFAKPTKTLFAEVRDMFALEEQVRVHMLIDQYIGKAIEYIESLPDDMTPTGEKRRCPASTRQGTPCQRDPRSGREYCPSHRHLEIDFEVDVEVTEELVAA